MKRRQAQAAAASVWRDSVATRFEAQHMQPLERVEQNCAQALEDHLSVIVEIYRELDS